MSIAPGKFTSPPGAAEFAKRVFGPVDAEPVQTVERAAVERADHTDTLGRCLKYLDKCDNAISGAGGHNALLWASRVCVRFDLDEQQHRQALEHFSTSKSDPPWSARELEHKISEARRLFESERGLYLVNSNANGTGIASVTASSSVESEGQQDRPETAPVLKPVSLRDMMKQYPRLKPPVIDGILREEETANVIAPSKVGKSWLVYGLALSIRTGRPWLDAYPTRAGRVLIIDNELHPETITHRLPKVAEEMNIPLNECDTGIDTLSLRGRNVSVYDLKNILKSITPGHYRAIVVDAWYRTIPGGMSENSNADVMALYNALDNYAAMTRSAWIVVHHTSKGGQADKSVTDVGSGAGAQSRAADTHLVLRPHEEDGCVVLDAAVRSFPPLDPIALRWTYPVWIRAYSLDVKALKGRKSVQEARQEERDAEGLKLIRDAMSGGPLTTRQIRDRTGFGPERADRLLALLCRAEELTYSTTTGQGGKQRLYTLRTGLGTGLQHQTTSA